MKILITAILSLYVSVSFTLTGYNTSEQLTLDTVAPSLQLISPAGGETWYIGESQDIIWRAEDPHLTDECVNISCSIDSLDSFISLAEWLPNTGQWPWQLPFVDTDGAFVKISISDRFGNSSEVMNPNSFSILGLAPAAPDSLTIEIAEDLDAIISWNPVTTTIAPMSIPINPDGYYVFYADSPYEDEDHYFLLGSTGDTTFTHHKALEYRDQLYYRVVSYKDFSGRNDLSRDILQTGKRPITLHELLSNTPGGNK
ncbi:MAG: hypothetical protein LHW46_03200 [Candidatus Cloacimonetes bacterium]|jgi:hypothetical protein|nr:hypothetical protein [Candidatus Cloacimonadota bacterium]MCB5268698.1 hypothetical protein [Candidatus Cloacimonadota bacterium]MCK9334857.1 hypothetical protein [Candidatus Cloacimonadota bacterium]MDD3300985.1 hypothetical protein [Bacteroidales bacterium]MDY0338115.1 hypothetical protein [Candidatus Cloacimonadaceae bacterium]